MLAACRSQDYIKLVLTLTVHAQFVEGEILNSNKLNVYVYVFFIRGYFYTCILCIGIELIMVGQLSDSDSLLAASPTPSSRQSAEQWRTLSLANTPSCERGSFGQYVWRNLCVCECVSLYIATTRACEQKPLVLCCELDL